MTDRQRTSLERARLRKGFSRERVARQLSISSKTVERHESGATPVKRFQLEAYGAIYEVPLEDIVDMLDAKAAA